MTEEYPNRVVWAEIPVSDMSRAKKFYETLFMKPLADDNTGPNPMAMFPYPEGIGASGHIYPGKPATGGEGPTVHVVVFDELKDAMHRVKEGGGEVVSDVISIPPGSFFYAVDTEGNSIGVFKTAA